MATPLWIDGFDHYGVDTANSQNSRDLMLQGNYTDVHTHCYPVSDGRTGNHLFMYGGYVTTWLAKVLGSTHTVLNIGHAYTITAYAATAPKVVSITVLDAAGTIIGVLLPNPAGYFEYRKSTYNGTVLATASKQIFPNTTHHVEFKIKVDAVAGYVKLKIDGELAFSVDGINTSAGLGSIQMVKHVTYSGATGSCYIDDFYIYDTSDEADDFFIGDRRVGRLLVTADTAQADFTAVGAGSGYATINHSAEHDSDTTYLNAVAAPAVSEFVLEDITGSIGSIDCVMVSTVQRKTLAGTCSTKIGLKSNAVVGTSSDIPLTTDYTYWTHILKNNPDGNIPWTKDTLNAALLRLERSA